MDRNTTIAFVLIGAILIFWLYINTPPPPEKHTLKKSDSTLVQRDSLSINKSKTVEEKKERAADLVTEADSIHQNKTLFGKNFSAPEQKEHIIVIENDLIKMEVSTKGAVIKKYYLKKYKNWYSTDKNGNNNFYKTHVQLINYSHGSGPNIAFVSSDGKAINTAALDFTPNTNKSYIKLSGNDSLTVSFSFNVDSSRYIRKTYTFFGDKYSMLTNIDLVGMDDLISNNAYDLVWTGGIRFVEQNSVDEATYANASVFYGGENVVVDEADIGKKIEKDFNGRIDWVAIRNKYFSIIIAPKNPSGVDGAYIEGTKEGFKDGGVREFYNARITVPFKNTNKESKAFTVYIGPVDYDILKEYGNNMQAVVDFGSFFGLKFIVRPIAEYVLLPLFNFLHTLIPNYGFVIIVFSLIIKLVLYPLTKSSFQSMKKMQLLQPKITELKEKYKDDAQKLNKETMKLYSTYGVNPAGGCLPLILQMPIFIALWGLFKVAIELRQQPFILWIKDLATPDVIYTIPFKLPIFGINQISGLALLMGITTYFQQKMSVKDPKQQALVYLMPIMLTLMFMSFPSGLNLYYFMFNVFSIAQQYYINHKQDGLELQPVKNPKKTSGFMQRLMDAAEQGQKKQPQQRKKR